MALEAVVFAQGHAGYGPGWEPPCTPVAPWCGVPGAGGFGELFGDCDQVLGGSGVPNAEWKSVSRDQSDASAEPVAAVAAARRKRRRTKPAKNMEEIESQRRTHIAVERNRRRQMNEYLAVLRSLMPPSYAQRGDQASIVGGAINYVKELEQLLQSLEVQKSLKNRSGQSPFAGLFTFPQYSTGAVGSSGNARDDDKSEVAVADIEVTMVEGHASLKVLARRRPKQLLKLVAGMQQLRIPPLHINMTTVDAMVFYSFSLKVEDGSKLGSVEDIANAVHEIMSSMHRHEEAGLS